MIDSNVVSYLQQIQIDLDKYEKQEKIGYGGFSSVFKICEKESRKIYSAKILSKSFDDNNFREIDDFIKEVYILSSLKHPLFLQFIGMSNFNFKKKATASNCYRILCQWIFR